MSKVMLCDDDYDTLEVVKLLLESRGHEVIITSSGEECIQQAPDEKPDFIFLDIMMPDMDGWKTLGELKKIEELKETPIAMLTCKQLDIETFDLDKMDGLVAYIYKPVTQEELQEVLEEYL